MKKTIYLLAAVLTLGACAKEAPQGTKSGEIRFDISFPATKASATAFESGDRMSLYAVEYAGAEQVPLQIGGNYINNAQLAFDGTAWSATPALYWSESACDFYGIYPWQSSISSVSEQPFSLVSDQNSAKVGDTPGGYEASDLLWAKAENASYGDGAVQLRFRHLMSKCVVNVVKGPSFEGEIPDDIVLHIYNTTTDCHVDFTKGTVEKDAFGAKGTITAKKLSNEQFEAVLVPQYIEKKTPLFEVTMGGIAYLLDYSMSFRPGYCHTVNLTLNTSPDQEMIEINIDVEEDDFD